MGEGRIFISHASQDEAVASRIVAYLEAHGVACWVAPRDISPRSIYAEEITKGIQSCAACAVIVSNAANASDAVKRELELASHYRRPFIPIRIDATEPGPGLDYYLRNAQWTDYRREGDHALDRLVTHFLGRSESRSEPASFAPRRADDIAPTRELPFTIAAKNGLLPLLIGGAIIFLGIIGWIAWPRQDLSAESATEEVLSSPTEVRADAPNILAAVADSRRPVEDTRRDADRRPADTLAFAQIELGDRVADIFPGGGYWTRLFAVAVGDQGRVYPTIRPDGVAGEFETPVLAVAAEYGNAIMARRPYDALAYPELLDVVFTAQNYHDLPLAAYHLGDRNAMNRAAFSSLRPGGLYVVIDHSAIDGSSVQTDAEVALHRIDQATVRREVEAAGFVFDGEANFLRNPADDRTASVFDEAIRGRTDQFVMRFRKPE